MVSAVLSSYSLYDFRHAKAVSLKRPFYGLICGLRPCRYVRYFFMSPSVQGVLTYCGIFDPSSRGVGSTGPVKLQSGAIKAPYSIGSKDPI